MGGENGKVEVHNGLTVVTARHQSIDILRPANDELQLKSGEIQSVIFVFRTFYFS